MIKYYWKSSLSVNVLMISFRLAEDSENEVRDSSLDARTAFAKTMTKDRSNDE